MSTEIDKEYDLIGNPLCFFIIHFCQNEQLRIYQWQQSANRQ